MGNSVRTTKVRLTAVLLNRSELTVRLELDYFYNMRVALYS